MRSFILGSSAVTSGAVTTVTTEGKVGFAYLNNGVLTFDDGTHIKDKGYIVLIRSAANGGNIVLPFYKHHFKYNKGVYDAATQFTVDVPLPASVTPGKAYTIIAAKKGVKFNERNRWTATVVATANDTTATIAAKLKKYFDDNVEALGLTVTYTAADQSDPAKLTFTATAYGVDYAIVCADELYGTTLGTVTAGIPAMLDAKMVADMAEKAAADAGIEYTYLGDANYLYPKYPFNPLAASDSADNGFTVYNIFFSERREVKTTIDDVVNQLVQIAFSNAAFTGLDTVLANLG